MRIVLATDGSKGARAAAGVLADLPLEGDCSLEVVHVAADGTDPNSVSRLLNESLELLSHSTATLTSSVRHGHAVETLLNGLQQHPADLLVVGATGHSGVARLLLGSVAERLAMHAPCPVLVVRPDTGGLRRILVGVDGSKDSIRAARWIAALPLDPSAEIRILGMAPNHREIAAEHLMVMPPLVDHPTSLGDWQRVRLRAPLDALCAEIEASGRRCSVEIRSGDPGSGIVGTAEDEGCDLVVVGSKGLTGLDRFLLGSVSANVLRHAPCSVLVAR